VIWSLQTTPNASTGYTPFFQLFDGDGAAELFWEKRQLF
jgi:hypothetical protein